MGGILLIAAMIVAYIICYWSIIAELYNDKTLGLLGLKKSTTSNLTSQNKPKRAFEKSQNTETKTTQENQEVVLDVPPAHPYLR